jgi:hypothetical protein
MIESSSSFLILADESAEWKVAGLPQLDRLALALSEFCESIGPDAVVDAAIFWTPDIPSAARWLPRHAKIKRVRLTESLNAAQLGAQVLSTRLFFNRHGLHEFLLTAPSLKMEEPIGTPATSWNQLAERFLAAVRGGRSEVWKYLQGVGDIPACEKKLLERAGKPQDGFVAKFLNRPISRAVTRFLLKYDIHPTAWSMSIFVLPIVAFAFLARGDYGGILIGAAIFQLYSILDGCDGEIARAKYLESERGARIDDFLDMLGSLLFVIGLGLGLFRSRSSIYFLEGILCAAVILANEWLLRFSKAEADPPPTAFDQILYPRHRQLIQTWPLSLLNEKFARWLIQFTKRDVAILMFLLLAVADLPQWILHLWLGVSAATLSLSRRARLERRRVRPDSRP